MLRVGGPLVLGTDNLVGFVAGLADDLLFDWAFVADAPVALKNIEFAAISLDSYCCKSPPDAAAVAEEAEAAAAMAVEDAGVLLLIRAALIASGSMLLNCCCIFDALVLAPFAERSAPVTEGGGASSAAA